MDLHFCRIISQESRLNLFQLENSAKLALNKTLTFYDQLAHTRIIIFVNAGKATRTQMHIASCLYARMHGDSRVRVLRANDFALSAFRFCLGTVCSAYLCMGHLCVSAKIGAAARTAGSWFCRHTRHLRRLKNVARQMIMEMSWV